MTNPIIKLHNIETGEVIEREMNADELARYQTDKAKAQEQDQAVADVATAKAGLLDKLGITEEEAKLLLS